MKMITVCMGSSCYSRGNSNNTQIIHNFIEKNNLKGLVEVRGCLCESECKQGPNIRIDDKLFSNVSSEGLVDLLQHELLKDDDGQVQSV